MFLIKSACEVINMSPSRRLFQIVAGLYFILCASALALVFVTPAIGGAAMIFFAYWLVAAFVFVTGSKMGKKIFGIFLLVIGPFIWLMALGFFVNPDPLYSRFFCLYWG
jgi:hypothetical protein